MPKKIIKINFEVPGDESKLISLDSEFSLLDYDIAIVNPDISDFYGFGDTDYLGKPSLSDTNSFRLKERIKHWRHEILETIKAGNTVFLLLNVLQKVYVSTGEKQFSGTGRNRQTTNIVAPFRNYAIIPAGIDVVNSKGKVMRLTEKENIFASYWAELGAESEYRVFVEREGLNPFVKTKSGEKIVGAYLRYKSAAGALVLLPYLNFERDEFYYEKDDALFWAEEAIEIGKKFISSIIGLDKKLREKSETTPIPSWAEQELYVLPKEKVIRKKLLALEIKIDALQEERDQFEQNLTDETFLKNLLFENGKNLELSILDALKLIGFSASQYRDDVSEFDAVFESKEGRFLGEAEGRNNKPISIDKLRQLEMNILEDFDRDEIDKMAKGVLFGNAQRLLPPDDRGDFFTQKCLIAANRSDTALVKTVDLFIAAKYLSDKNNNPFAKKCREAILGTKGIVLFPSIPEKNSKVKKVVTESKSGNK